jgi:hypothetical protein
MESLFTLTDNHFTSHDYQDMKGRVDKDIVLVKDKLTELQQEVSPFKIYIQKEVPMLENLLEYYRKSDGATKKKILGCIFAKKLVLEKGKVATPVFTEPIQLILRISEVLGSSKKKQEVDFDLLCRLVPRTCLPAGRRTKVATSSVNFFQLPQIPVILLGRRIRSENLWSACKSELLTVFC